MVWVILKINTLWNYSTGYTEDNNKSYNTLTWASSLIINIIPDIFSCPNEIMFYPVPFRSMCLVNL